jgi:tetratricopeptide (TPR) repeat protein
MKKLIIVITFLFAGNSFALVKKAAQLYEKSNDPNKNAYIAQELYKSKYYFSSVVFAKEHLVGGKSFSKEFEHILEELVLKTGTMSFYGLKDRVLSRYPSPSLSFILGLRRFNYKRYKGALKALQRVPENHRFSPEAKFMMGSSYNLINKFTEARASYNSCIAKANDLEGQAKNKKLKRYFAIIRESCIIHKARILFKERKYQASLKAYDEIPKTSYRWPYILLEKAWAAYHLGNYNRVLGILVTYRSPLMTSYFFPEAEVLSSLSYFKLCLWGDSLKLVEQYYNVYRPHADALKGILVKNKNSHTYFLKMLLKPIKEMESMNPFVRNLMTQVRKRVKFSLDLVNFQKAQNELKYIKKLKYKGLREKMEQAVNGSIAWRAKHLNHYIKKQMFGFINDMHKFSYEMFNIKLEVSSLQRDLVYSNKKLISDRSRGSLDNVTRTDQEHFFVFNGEFWGDELGEYSFGLKSNCKRIRKGKKELEESLKASNNLEEEE